MEVRRRQPATEISRKYKYGYKNNHPAFDGRHRQPATDISRKYKYGYKNNHPAFDDRRRQPATDSYPVSYIFEFPGIVVYWEKQNKIALIRLRMSPFTMYHISISCE